MKERIYKAQFTANNGTQYIAPLTFTNKIEAVKHIREALFAELHIHAMGTACVWIDDGKPFHPLFTPDKCVYRKSYYKDGDGKFIKFGETE